MSGAEGVFVGACVATAACVAAWTLRRLWRDVCCAIWEESLQASTVRGVRAESARTFARGAAA